VQAAPTGVWAPKHQKRHDLTEIAQNSSSAYLKSKKNNTAFLKPVHTETSYLTHSGPNAKPTSPKTASSSNSLKIVPATWFGLRADQFRTGRRYFGLWRCFAFNPPGKLPWFGNLGAPAKKRRAFLRQRSGFVTREMARARKSAAEKNVRHVARATPDTITRLITTRWQDVKAGGAHSLVTS